MPAKKQIHRGRLIDLNIETAILPDGGELELDIVRHPGGAVVVAISDSNEVCLLRQFRYAVGNAWLWELPAGCVDAADPSPLATATRELREEAGLVADNWSSLGTLLPSPGFCDERLYLYLARDLAQLEANRHDDEFIEIHWLPLLSAVGMAASGEITDAKTVAGLLRAQSRLTG